MMARRAAISLLLVMAALRAAAGPLPAAAADVDPAWPGAGGAGGSGTVASAALERMVESLEIPGLVVAVGRGGEPVWTGAFGLADLEQGVPATDGARLRLGEVSRLFNVAAMLRLAEAGRLDLDAPIQRYVSSYPVKPEGDVTARLLAGHLAGLGPADWREPGPGAAPDGRPLDRIEEAVALFAAAPLQQPPGRRAIESPRGMLLLSAAVEGASGLAYLDYLEGAVLRPLGLGRTGPDDPRAVVPGRARFYDRNEEEGRPVNAPCPDPAPSWGDSGLLASASDLARLGLAFIQPGFLEAPSRQAALTSMEDGQGRETGIGLAWRTGRDARGRAMAHQVGSPPGGRAVLLAYPDAGVAVALLTNLGDAPLLALETAQVAAAPFLPPPGAAASAPPAGEFVFAGRFNDMPAAGTFILWEPAERRPGAVGAWRSDLGWDWTITGVAPAADGFDLHLLHPQAGLIPLPLTREGDGWRAELAAGPHRFDVRVDRAPRRPRPAP